MLELDHVLIAASDLKAAAAAIEERYGLASLEGGRHPGWGTTNRIVPLGDTYLELVAVVDDTKAGASTFGRWIMAARPRLFRPLGWAVRTDQLDEIAKRLDLTPESGSRVTRSGETLSWRVAGIEQAANEPCLPFFIEWSSGAAFPGNALAKHPSRSARVARLELRGDPNCLAAWLGPHHLRINCAGGSAAVSRIIVQVAAREIVLEGDSSVA